MTDQEVLAWAIRMGLRLDDISGSAHLSPEERMAYFRAQLASRPLVSVGTTFAEAQQRLDQAQALRDARKAGGS